MGKLQKIGISDPFLSWFYTYLTGRDQMVKIYSLNSNLVSVSLEVLQGGRSFIAIFLFDFYEYVGNVFRHCEFSFFTDDL